jgi:hypothetical protein
VTTTLVLAVLVALGVALFLGYRTAKLKGLLAKERALAEAQAKLLKAMSIAVGRESKLRETFKKVSAATTSSELNQLYKTILSKPPDTK